MGTKFSDPERSDFWCERVSRVEIRCGNQHGSVGFNTLLVGPFFVWFFPYNILQIRVPNGR